MLILILIDIQYLQNIVFSFEKGSNGKKSLFVRVLPYDKKFTMQNLPFPPLGGLPNPLTQFGKPCNLRTIDR